MALPAPGTTVPGRGAWNGKGHATGKPFYVWLWYWYNDGFDPQKSYSHRAVHLGVTGIQQMLLLAGVSVKVSGTYDRQTASAVKAFQLGKGLKADGVYGQVTARTLTHVLIRFQAKYHGVPPEVLWGFVGLESGFDPAAVGTKNGYDSGLCQINLSPGGPPLYGHGDTVTPEMAFNPYFNLDWTCRNFKRALDLYDGKGPDLQLDASIAHHNSPKNAGIWYEIGWSGADEQITKYVEMVKAQMATYPKEAVL